ncbi:MAG: hypothetical protein GXO75_01045 [Calditrichaeota bacterium]|nr:hypothetical protein [Calditrichota bacterium]
MKVKTFFIVMMAGIFVAHSSFAGGLFRSTRISAKVGMMNQADASSSITAAGTIKNSYEGQGAFGSLEIGRHVAGGLWGDLSLGIHALEAKSEINFWGETNHAVAIMPIMLGLRTYIFHGLDTGFQPYFLAAGGPVIGIEATQKVGLVTVNESHTETTVGAELGAGVNMLLTNWFSIDVSGGYMFMSDFSTPLNGTENFGGWNASFGFSVFLGRQ